MLDQQILFAAINSRAAFDRVSNYVSAKELSPHTGFWWKILLEYYRRDRGAKCASVEVLREQGRGRIANPKHVDALLAVLADAPSAVPSTNNVVSAVLGMLRTNRAAEFASAALGGDQTKAQKLLDEVNELWSKDSLDEETERIYAKPVEELFSVVGSERRIPILPASLNIRIGGGVLPGHHVLIFGRTEIGKSAFVINLIAGFVKQKQRVLYVGNEDEINVVKARCLCRITAKTIQEAELHKSEAMRLYKERGGEDLLRLVHMQPGTIDAIEEEVQDFKPTVLVLDQIRNLSSPEDGMTRKLEASAIRFRSLLSRHSLIGVSVTQASDKSDRNSADTPVWLSAGDVDSSRVGLPAQADLMLGIGGNQDMINRGQRAISIVKNKLFSGPQSREGIIVNFDLTRSVVT